MRMVWPEPLEASNDGRSRPQESVASQPLTFPMDGWRSANLDGSSRAGACQRRPRRDQPRRPTAVLRRAWALPGAGHWPVSVRVAIPPHRRRVPRRLAQRRQGPLASVLVAWGRRGRSANPRRDERTRGRADLLADTVERSPSRRSHEVRDSRAERIGQATTMGCPPPPRPRAASVLLCSWFRRRTISMLLRIRARIVSGRLRNVIDRMRARIVHRSPEYGALLTVRQGLESELRRISELGELTHLQRLLHDQRPDDLHLNACGDFQLMAREHWFALLGYPEFQMFSMNIDGLFSSIAYYAGIRRTRARIAVSHLPSRTRKGFGLDAGGRRAVAASNRRARHHVARRQGRVRLEHVHALAQAADDLQHVQLGLRRRRTGGVDRRARLNWNHRQIS